MRCSDNRAATKEHAGRPQDMIVRLTAADGIAQQALEAQEYFVYFKLSKGSCAMSDVLSGNENIQW